ncbi:MAG: NAD(P)/FAD-dependent oxidoreductase [Gammaproteobacteria bacterium]|nr:NAD(P)/FAD-dependent oxidoreductase [Gammaproteobacteria bacterium]
MSQYDSIIIGAGHNGLVCAAYLARSGQRVLVLEASASTGGLGASHEFHPGFHCSVAHSISHFSPRVAKDLDLRAHGLETNAESIATIGLSTDQDHVVIKQGSVAGSGEQDARAYEAYLSQMGRFADVLKPFWSKTMPRLGSRGFKDLMTFVHLGASIRLSGKQTMQELLRVASLPMRDLMDEQFENDLLKAALSWDGLIGAKLAPRSPNSAVLATLYRMSGESRGAHSLPAGGVNGLIESLKKSAQASDVEIRCNTRVARIIVDGNEDGLVATGVELENGETISGIRVVSATDPQRTFLGLVGAENLDIGFTNQIRRLRCNGYVAKLHLALNGEPDFAGLDRPDGRMIIAPNMDAIEFAFDNAKYGELPTNPVMEVVVPSLHDESCAPAGQHVLSAHVMYVPYELKGGWTDAAREQVCERAIETIAQYAPTIREQILHKELLTPADLEQSHNVTGGHWHHTEFAMDQMLMMRPTYGAAQYNTPVPGLYLCSAGSHPGGDITGTAGYNAAREILR